MMCYHCLCYGRYNLINLITPVVSSMLRTPPAAHTAQQSIISLSMMTDADSADAPVRVLPWPTASTAVDLCTVHDPIRLRPSFVSYGAYFCSVASMVEVWNR